MSLFHLFCLICKTVSLFICYVLGFNWLIFQAEFMEHDEKPLPIDIRLLGALAEKVPFLLKSKTSFLRLFLLHVKQFSYTLILI